MMDFSILNNFFDHIYVITLERAKDRHEQIVECLDGLDYKFFYGSDKKVFTIDELEEAGIYDEKKAKAIHRYDKPMNKGQIGCAWSHRQVYEDMVMNNYQKVLVLEDDVLPNKEGFAILEEILSQIPTEWELLYFDYHKNLESKAQGVIKQKLYHIQKMLGKIKWSHETIRNLYARKYSINICHAGFHDFTSAYAITLPAAKKLIKEQTPIAYIADNLLAHACSNKIVNGFITVPKVFVQESQMQDKKDRISYVED